MLFPALYRHFLTRISIAILAQMRAGVVFANVLAHDAAAELALAFVAVVLFLHGISLLSTKKSI